MKKILIALAVLRHDVLRAFVRDHGLSATKYQDYGWPAKDLDL